MPTHAATGQPGVTSPGRRDVILHMLRASDEPRSIAGIAGELGVHPNTIRFHMDALLRAGRVEHTLGDSAGRGRPPVLFRAGRRMDPTGPTNYRLLAGILTGYVARSRDAAGIAAQLGRSTSRTLMPASRQGRAPSKTRTLTELVELMEGLGRQPEPPDGPHTREIRLRHCLFKAWPNNTAR